MGDDPPPPAPGTLPATAPRTPAPDALRSTACANHPSRTAIGRCPTCRRLVCDECHVRIDGILHCSQCLRATAQSIERSGPGWAGRVVTAVAGLVVAALAFGAVSGALTTAGFLGGRGTRWFAATFEHGPRTGK